MIPVDLLKAASLTDALVAAGVPIETVRRVGNVFEIVYKAEATGPQRAQGANILAAFDSSDAAEQARQDAAKPELATLRDLAAAAIQNNSDFLALGLAANAAQVLAQVRRLSMQSTAVLRRLIQISDRIG